MSVSKSMLAIFLAGTVAMGSLCGCGASGQSEETTTESGSAPAAESVSSSSSEKTEEEKLQLVQVKTIEDSEYLRLRKTYFGKRFNPQSMNWPELYVECFEGLYTSEQKDGLTVYKGADAESYEISEDGLTVTFHLRKDAKWSDGTLVTADDYVAGWKYLLDPSNDCPYASVLANIAGAMEYNSGSGDFESVGITAQDDQTLVVTLKNPDPDFYKKTISPALYPIRQSAVDAANAKEDTKWGEDWQDCVFNGPYVISGYEKTHYVTLEKNEAYWNASSVLAGKVIWYLQVSDEMSMQMFEDEQLDAINLYGNEDESLLQGVEDGTVTEVDYNLPELIYCSYNLSGGPSGLMGQQEVRRALSMAVDREQLAADSNQTAAWGLVPATYTVGTDSYRTLKSEPLKEEADSMKGKEAELTTTLETAAGVTKDQITLIILAYAEDSASQAILKELSDSWTEKLGITVTVQTAETYDDFMDARDAGNYDLLFTSYSQAYDNIRDYLESFAAETNANNGITADDNYGYLLGQADAVTDAQQKADFYLAAEKELVSDSTYIMPLLYGVGKIYVKSTITGMTANPYGANPEAAYVDFSARPHITRESAETDSESESEAESESESEEKTGGIKSWLGGIFK